MWPARRSPFRRTGAVPQKGDVKLGSATEDLNGEAVVTATVLVCDNENILRRLVKATLQTHDIHVVEACDGDEALELARMYRPALVILDVMMPGKTGLDVLEELRRDPDLAETRVIVLTPCSGQRPRCGTRSRSRPLLRQAVQPRRACRAASSCSGWRDELARGRVGPCGRAACCRPRELSQAILNASPGRSAARAGR